MHRSDPVDGFRLAYDRAGRGTAVLLLHGWPGDRTDYRAVVPQVSAAAEVIVPDLRGFGESDRHPAEPVSQYAAAAQARSVIALIEELELGRPVLAGYDIGSRIAQAVARERPDLVRELVVSPPVPGIGDRILSPQAQLEFWYQPFHQLALATQLIDGQPDMGARLSASFLVTLVRAGFRAGPRAPGALAVDVRAPGRVRGVGRLVPGGRRLGRHLGGRAGASTGRPARGPDHRAVAAP